MVRYRFNYFNNIVLNYFDRRKKKVPRFKITFKIEWTDVRTFEIDFPSPSKLQTFIKIVIFVIFINFANIPVYFHRNSQTGLKLLSL